MNAVGSKLLQGLGMALVCSFALVMVFIFLKSFLVSPTVQDKPVVQTVAPVYLDESKVVSFFKEIPLIYDYKRVKIEENELYVDLIWPEESMQDELFKSIYADALRLIAATFTGTNNVDQLYLRFIRFEGSSPVLILAVSCQRQESLISDLIQSDLAFEQPKIFLERYARLIYGAGWRK